MRTLASLLNSGLTAIMTLKIKSSLDVTVVISIDKRAVIRSILPPSNDKSADKSFSWLMRSSGLRASKASRELLKLASPLAI